MKRYGIIAGIIFAIVVLTLCLVFLITLNGKIKKFEKFQKIKVVNNAASPIRENFLSENKTDKTKTILIIGNSITCYHICDFWYGEWGMAASKKENDYVHLLCTKLSEKVNVNLTLIMGSVWEFLAQDRYAILDLFGYAFEKNKFDYAVVQLGENVSNYETLENDFMELIKFIQSKNSDTRIVLVGNFWQNEEMDLIKQKVCNELKISYADLREISKFVNGNEPNREYHRSVDDIVYDENGEAKKILHDGVAMHPNDKAMKYIAEKIFEKIKD